MNSLTYMISSIRSRFEKNMARLHDLLHRRHI
jgi:hypothetical protein